MTWFDMRDMMQQELCKHDLLIDRIRALRDSGKYYEAYEVINQANIAMGRILLVYYKMYGVKKTAEKLYHLRLQMSNS